MAAGGGGAKAAERAQTVLSVSREVRAGEIAGGAETRRSVPRGFRAFAANAQPAHVAGQLPARAQARLGALRVAKRGETTFCGRGRAEVRREKKRECSEPWDSKFRESDKEGFGRAPKMFGRSPSGRRQAARRGPDKPRIFLRSR